MDSFESKGTKPIEKFIKFLTILSISLILLIYFFSPTRQINNKYNCGFDVYFNNWKESKLFLLEQREKIIAEGKYPKRFFTNDVEDAYLDLEKRQYLSQAQIREAERIIEIDKEIRELWVSRNKKRLKEIKACLQYEYIQ
jgi:hypothetical protein